MADVKERLKNFIQAGKDLLSNSDNEKMEAHITSTSGLSNTIFSVPFDGEKNLGEIGPIKDYYLEYDLLRLRSWQSYLESEITQTVLGKFSKWIIGAGLKLQSEPNKHVLNSEGITADLTRFSKDVESRFGLYVKSKNSDFSGMNTLNSLAATAFLNAKIGGDVLVVLRLIDGIVKVQLIDGEFVRGKSFSNQFISEVLPNKNKLLNGIEFGKNGEHVAYHVMERNQETTRIKAKLKNGLTQAFLVYGFRYRLSNDRGIPLISAVLETLKKMERYKEATVGSAEERQKIAYFIKHGASSTGENPLAKQMAKAFDVGAVDSNLPKDVNGKDLANTIAASTNKAVFNMPNDSELQQLESKNELHFKEFYSVNIDLICASLGIPPEVAMSKYDSNFSASRAALKDWEHTILIEREKFKDEFYQNIYNFWLEINVMQNNVSAPGYVTSKRNSAVVQSYQNSRFIGAGVPHIDPLKEVMAERAKLGEAGAQIPLTTVEKSTEALNTGDSEQNLDTFNEEVIAFRALDIEVKEPVLPNDDNDDDDEN